MDRAQGMITFRVNGVPVQVPGGDRSLLRVLRDDLHLTGTKNGCSSGHCGACTVLLNKEAIKSCLTSVEKAVDKEVLTIEGLGTAEGLDPLQAAFVQEGALQCGFCTPGLIMASKELLLRNPRPTEADVKKFLGGNTCRCTGYTSIMRAIMRAAHEPESCSVATVGGDGNWLGKQVPGYGAVEKVTGRAIYADDLNFPGTLYARVLRSEYPHAEVLGVDVGVAKRAPGVVAVFTSQDVPGVNRYGLMQADQPLFAEDRVRFLGDPLAMVVAETEGQAADALKLIKVIYRPLEAISSPLRALEPDAPKIHEKGNILSYVKTRLREEKIDRLFAECDLVVERTYTTPFVEHAYLEPEAAVGVPNDDRGVTVYAGSQNVFADQRQIAPVLGLPLNKVRVVLTTTGGAFGGKEDMTVQPYVALGAFLLKRPVKLVFSREESLLCSTKRHAFIIEYKSGVTRDGKVRAVQVKCIADTGAYASVGDIVITRAVTHAVGPYKVEAAKVDGYAIFTNNPIGGAMRGFGVNQVNFACECQMDILAEKLSMDPVEFRLRNGVEVGSVISTGQRLTHSVGLKETLRRAAQTADWAHRRKGVGVACALKNVGLGHGSARDKAGARVVLDSQGLVTVYAGAADMGQGVPTVIAQVAATELGLDYSRLKLIMGDTATTPEGGVSSASRQTLFTGNAVKLAAGKLKDALISKASWYLGVPPEELKVSGGAVVASEGGPSLTFADLAIKEGGLIQAEALFEPGATHPMDQSGVNPEYKTHITYGYATQIAEVEVDERTGKVTVKRVVASHDVGRAINLQGIHGQIEGGVFMGMGYALSEQYKVENCVPKTVTYKKCSLPSIRSLPQIVPVVVEEEEPSGPYGAKGCGEITSICTAPAIINAIYDAIGVRIYDLPATPEKILKGLQEKRKAEGC